MGLLNYFHPTKRFHIMRAMFRRAEDMLDDDNEARGMVAAFVTVCAGVAALFVVIFLIAAAFGLSLAFGYGVVTWLFLLYIVPAVVWTMFDWDLPEDDE